MRSLIPIAVLAGILAAQQPAQTVWDGVYTTAQAKRGEAAYASECARCHGTQLTGGESAPPLTGIDFFSNWNGLSVGELFERIRTSMPADRPGRLTREQNSEIIAYMLQVSQFPAGERELGRRVDELNQIRLELYKSTDK